MSRADEKEPKGCMVAALVTMLLLSPLAAFWKAYVIAHLWGWYLVPLGLPALSKLQAFGLAWIVFLLTQTQGDSLNSSNDKREASDFLGAFFAVSGVIPGVALLIGWLAWRLFS